MQNTFSQSGNDSKWFLIKIIFQNRYVALETPSRPTPPFMANTILNFHFDYLTPSLSVHLELLYHNKFHYTCSDINWIKIWLYTECFPAFCIIGEIIAKILSRGHEERALFAARETKWPVNHPPPNIPYIRFIFRSVLDVSGIPDHIMLSLSFICFWHFCPGRV